MTDKTTPNTPSKPDTSLQASKKLVVDAIVEMTNIVESMHHRISPITKLTRSSEKERTKGLTGMVYSSIRNLTELVGKSLDLPLGVLSKTLKADRLTASVDTLKSALNGVIGDHLVQRNSPLAIAMKFRKDGVEIAPQTIAKFARQSNGKLVIMVHGLCMNDLQWQQSGHDHGQKIETELGHTAIYLHYNTGLHISKNGERFSQLLEQCVKQFNSTESDLALQISIIAHSMGGLVSRSAHYHALSNDYQWPEYFSHLVCLGTPHHGAPLEKAGNWIDLLLGMHDYSAPLTKLTQIRSAGITDLRHGNIIESDWKAIDRFDFVHDQRTPVQLPKDVNCYTVATTTQSASNMLTEQVIGDGLVPLDSALGKHSSESFRLNFDDQHIGKDINHIELLSDLKIYKSIKRWISNT